MKVSMFHLMSHRDLPADFEQRYHSVWVDPPWHELATPEQYADYYRWSIEELVYAAEKGIDGICVNEHHQNAYGGVPSPNLMGAALAQATQHLDVALVQMGSTLPTTTPPIRVAEEYAMLDVLSGGRVLAGMPVGTPMDVNLCYGVPPIEQRERYYEAHDLILKAWTAEEAFAWNGKYFQLPHVNLWPRPIQRPYPPVWIPGVSSVSTWDFVAQHDHAYCVLTAFAGTQGIQGAINLMKGFWDRIEEQGAEPNPFRAGMALLVMVGESMAQIERDYAPHLKYFWTKLTHVAPEYWAIPGYQDYRSLLSLLQRFGSQSIAEDLSTWTFQDFVDRKIVIAGTPDEVTEQLQWLISEMRIGHLMALFQLGSMPKGMAMQITDAFCDEVLPRLRPIWEDEWENRWWPQRLRAPRAVAQTASVPAGGGA